MGRAPSDGRRAPDCHARGRRAAGPLLRHRRQHLDRRRLLRRRPCRRRERRAHRRGNHAASARVRRRRQRDRARLRDPPAHQHRQRRVRLCSRREPPAAEDLAPRQRGHRRRGGDRQQLCDRPREAGIDLYPLRREARQHLPHRAQLRPGRGRLLHGRLHDGGVDHHRSPLHDRRQLSGLGAPHAGRRCRAGGPVDGDRRRDARRGTTAAIRCSP